MRPQPVPSVRRLHGLRPGGGPAGPCGGRQAADRCGDDVEQALACAGSAHVAFLELTRGWLCDADLDETGGGTDAVARLAAIMENLRDVARIIENRQLREQAGVLQDDQ